MKKRGKTRKIRVILIVSGSRMSDHTLLVFASGNICKKGHFLRIPKKNMIPLFLHSLRNSLSEHFDFPAFPVEIFKIGLKIRIPGEISNFPCV